jgi:predicted  nucleic acid-binding Zn-ribbon protein
MNPLVPDVEFRKPGLFTRALHWISGIDEETLHECPAHDWDTVRAIAVLFIFVWILQAAELSIVAHQLLSPEGEVRPELIIGSMFIATLILLLDSYVFVRAGFHADGLNELARGGLDLTGGLAAKIKAGLFLALRIFLSLGFAQLTAIFLGLILFRPDITAEIDRFYQQQNATLIASATRQVDSEIQRADDAVKGASAHAAALQQQVAAMRDGAVNPAASDAAIQSAQQEINQLLAEKARRDAELVAAQTFAANELAGIKADPANSGVPGAGPVRAAARERVEAATANDAAANQSLAEARARLGELRKQVASNADDRGHQAQLALPALETDLQAATTQLAALRDNLAKLTRDRDETIRADIENSPERIGRDAGFLAQLSALKRLAQDPEIAAIILLIDLTSFGLELAAVLAKVTSFVPTTYAALLARNAYMRVVEIVDEMDETLRQRPSEPDSDVDRLEPIHPAGGGDGEAVDDPRPVDEGLPLDAAPAVNGAGAGLTEAKRPRGRPRKFALN